MYEERNQYQITRKDARGCFVESLSDAFPIGKAHFALPPMILVARLVSVRRTTSIFTLIWMRFWNCAENWSAVN